MRILLDENIPVQLKGVLVGHDVYSVNEPAVGWKNIRNGLLLTRMAGRFDLLVTADRNIFSQQNLSGSPISILVLPTNRRKPVLALGDIILELLVTITGGQYIVLDFTGKAVITSFNGLDRGR